MFNIKKLVNVIITFIIIAIIGIAVYKDFDTIKTWPIIKDFFTVKETNRVVVENEKTKYTAAKKTNDDVLGWLSWDAVSLDIPVVGTNDNNFYLLRNAQSRYDGIGAAFLDKSNRGELKKVNVIYGRNAKGVFDGLKQIFDMDDARKIYLFDGQKTREYTVFSAYKSKSGKEDFDSGLTGPDEISKLVKHLKSKGSHQWDVKGKNELLILCSYKSQLDNIQNVICALRTK